jgi:hypothetical protein
MSAQALFDSLASAGETQLRGAYQGLSPALYDDRLVDGLMSPKEIAGHLYECCIAAQALARGEEHKWGSVPAPEGTGDQVVAAMFQERERAVAACRGITDEERLAHALQFLTLHDAYHVGQIAALRLVRTPDWDAYSIY